MIFFLLHKFASPFSSPPSVLFWQRERFVDICAFPHAFPPVHGNGPNLDAFAQLRKLSQKVCKLLNDSLGVPEDRVYLNFTDVEASNWGWNGSTFG